ncbi:MAG: histidinol-phosphate aminotransferase family protein [Actinomycetota bacterium]|nr:histidinol-phosphate aminotransferase family protein [Actinomycetota bacterium]
MGLLDYYRQFEDVDPEEARQELRERRAREKKLALQEVPDVDLSGTEWPDFPDSEVVNASIYTARGRVNGYPDRDAKRIRRVLAGEHRVEPEQIALGNGAAELLQAASYALLSESDEMLTPWPSYPLYPLMAARARATPVAVEPDPGELRAAMSERTRLLVLCNPNDPTGTYLRAEEVAALAASLPERAHVLVDEALVHFQDAEPPDSVLRLVDAFPRLLVVRTFSKIYGLSGLRAGYAVGSPASKALLDRIAPVLGVNALTQAAVYQALKIGGAEVQRRREAVIRERSRLLEALHGLPVDVTDSQANFLWMCARGMPGKGLADRLREHGVIVAPGAPLGEADFVRATVRDEAAGGRLLEALRRVLEA